MLANDGPSTSLTLLKRVSDPENDPVWDAGWADFFKRYKPVIDAWCRTVGNHHEAEEISSAVWEALVKALPKFVYDPDGRFRAWLRTVVKNEVNMYLRRHKRRRDRGSGDPNTQEMLVQVSAPLDTEGLTDEISETLNADLERVVCSVKARLKNPNTWEAFYRTRIDGQEASRVAADLGMKIGAVYRAANRVKSLIRGEVARL
jgi:RNA polymerase sigma-70 factor (ECF subfamily)